MQRMRLPVLPLVLLIPQQNDVNLDTTTVCAAINDTNNDDNENENDDDNLRNSNKCCGCDC